MTQEEPQLLRGMMREEISGALAPVQQDIAGMKEELTEIKEDGKITRKATSFLVQWTEQAQVEVRIPLYHVPKRKPNKRP